MPRPVSPILRALTAAALLLAVAFVHARSTRDALVAFGIGDALAYVRVAWNVGHGLGSTWDGLQPTNGYHPLWMLLHVPLGAVAETPWEALAGARILWAATGVAAAAAWGLLVGRATGSVLAGCVATLLLGASGWALTTLVTGMETPLVLLLVALVLLTLPDRLDGPLDGARTGLLLALGVLARLDAVFVLVPAALVAVARLRRPGPVAALVAAGAAGVGPYLAWNLARFGSLQPVSGLVKQAEAPSADVLLRWLTAVGRTFAEAGLPEATAPVMLGLVGLAVAAVPVVAVRTRVVPASDPLLLVFPAAIAHWLYYALRMRELNVAWHLYLVVAAGCAAVALLVAAVDRHLGDRGRVLALVAVIGLLGATDAAWLHVKRVNRGAVLAALEAGDRLAETLPAGATYLMYDSWFAAVRTPDLHPVDLSGLVGDADMVRLARARDYRAVVERFRPEVVLLHVPGGCRDLRPEVRWATDVHGVAPFRIAAVAPEDFVGAWEDLPEEARRGAWLPPLLDRLVCAS